MQTRWNGDPRPCHVGAALRWDLNMSLTNTYMLTPPPQTTAVKQLDTPLPVIDADPHFSRVVRSFRSSDYAAMAGATAAFPLPST